MKRVMAMALTVILLLAALPVGVFAQETELTRGQAVSQAAESVYQKCRSTAGKDSFAGFCGLMTSHQLYNTGINTELIVCDGNKQYDYYKDMELTSGGYYVKPYPAANYSLKGALNAISQNGRRDVFNLLVCFQWTNTEAGAIYGHAVLINAILDGTVYFVESFDYALGSLACKEGKTVTCSIAEFADYFNSWTTFEGVIYFGEKQYSADCQMFSTDVFLRTRFASTLRSQPCLVGQNGCVGLRSVCAGEVLYATAVCRNTQGELFYRIADGDQTGYISANAANFLQVNTEDLTLTDVDIPLTVAQGEDASISGTVSAGFGSVSLIRVEVTDSTGTVVLRSQLEAEGSGTQLSSLNESLQFNILDRGSYRLSVWARFSNVLVKETGFTIRSVNVCLWEQSLVIGDGEPLPSRKMDGVKNGWVRENGTWYCYEKGQPRTGWVTRFGVDYYLNDDGSVTTGFQELDGWKRYFSAMGALCTGWLTADEGIYYWISDGVYATGWQQIDGKWYCFGDDGLLIKEGTEEEALQ